MSTTSYIAKRILSSIPLLLVVSVISFLIIRLDINISNINLSIFIFLALSVFLFYLLTKCKSWYVMGLLSLISLMCLCWYLALLDMLPFDLFIQNKNILFASNFVCFTSLVLVYWFQSYLTKSTQLPIIIVSITLLVGSMISSHHLPINMPIKQIVLKSGDPLADLRFNPAISKEVLKAEEERLGLNKPAYIQYLLWLKGILHGDLGITQQNQPVSQVIKKPLLNTLLLSMCTLFCTWFIAIPLGVWAALKQNKFIDKLLAFLTSCGMSTPSFVLAVLGLLFALNTQLLPIGGLTSVNFFELNPVEKVFDIIKHLILPTIVLTLISIAALQRQMRANLLDVLRQEYITTATAKGLPTFQVIYKHALRNAINPLITIFGFEFAALLSGAALTETILSYPGLGALTLEAARKLDVNLTMTTLMLGATMLIAGNLVADILLKVADPRIKYESA